MSLGINISLIVATLLLFILVLSLIARHFATRDVRILADIARKYGGKITVNSFNSSATLDFSHRGVDLQFYQRKGLGGKGTRCYLRCDVDYTTPLSMHIAKGVSGHTTVGELKYLMSMPRVDVGSAQFNNVFLVRGNNQSFLNALLVSDVETKLLALRKKDPVLFMHPKALSAADAESQGANHRLEFSLHDEPKAREEVEEVIDDGLALIRRFLGGRATR